MPVEIGDLVVCDLGHIKSSGTFVKESSQNFRIVFAAYTRELGRFAGFTDSGSAYYYEEKLTYEIDPVNGIISSDSPIGQKLLGANIGYVFAIKTKAYRVSDILKET